MENISSVNKTSKIDWLVEIAPGNMAVRGWKEDRDWTDCRESRRGNK